MGRVYCENDVPVVPVMEGWMSDKGALLAMLGLGGDGMLSPQHDPVLGLACLARRDWKRKNKFVDNLDVTLQALDRILTGCCFYSRIGERDVASTKVWIFNCT
ncbi:hypothetical protein SELMODRAFT_406345 [Selaginella moellendorffii]|uniref:Uncharacterized protein n=1 Tax=Selaginella moellendorffii TaxID=88036 RepID=D8R229_SELML|nr:hypothetical protein SELMODRAFT_406345 [Selaginella moellendorffii]